MKRESFKSRLGFLFVSAGCAIGIGNVWRFPYVVGENGGGLFVALYFLFLIVLGLPVLAMELAVGREGKASALGAYRALEPKGSKWHLHGYLCLAGCVILMMYYTTVAGWMFAYFFRFLMGTFTPGMSVEACSGVFASLLQNPLEMTFWMVLGVVLGFLVVSRGLQDGLEKISKYMMGALLVLIIVLAVHSLSMPGAVEGISFYLRPDLSAVSKHGIISTVSAAMNQAFFTLSLGIGAMEIFGSFMSDENTLVSEGVRICLLDTFVAIMAGMIIFPACFSYNIPVNAGPGLIFETLPNVFVNMPSGRLWGTLFFLFMSFAAFSTVIAVFQNILSACMEMFGWSRRKATAIGCIGIIVLSLPCILGYNILSGVHPIAGMDILDSEDFLVSNLLLPLGSLIFLLFCVTKYGWGFENFLTAANKGKGIRIPAWTKWYFLTVLPALTVLILIQGLIF